MASSPSGTPVGPGARALLVWMQTNPDRLHGLLDEEAAGAGDDLSPTGDAAIRAHLRFVAEALAANAAPGAREAAEDFARRLPDLLAGDSRVEQELRAVGEAHAFEVERQFGGDAGTDPNMRSMIDRRVRIGAWLRAFLLEIDDARVMPEPIAPRAFEWMAAHQQRLGDTIFAMDRAAKQAEMQRHGAEVVDDPAVVRRIGRAAMVQGHMRFLVEAITAG